MLSYDSLLDCAKERGMPAGKLRGLVREYVQVLTLKTLSGLKGSEALFFLGGTALRLGYGMRRFSEDLDFDAGEISFHEWRQIIQETAHALSRWGMPAEVRIQEKGSLLIGDLRFSGVLSAYKIAVQPGEKLRVKVEANRPEYLLPFERKIISGFGEMFPVVFASPGLAFAEKIMALLNREMARDVYDIYFMGSKKWKPDRQALFARKIFGNPAAVILERIAGWGNKILAQMSRQFEPFLFDPGESELIKNAREFLPQHLEYLRKEN